MNNSGNSDIPDFSDLQFLEKKNAKNHSQTAKKQIANG